MIWLDAAAYVSDAAVLATYVTVGRRPRWFDIANAAGAPIVAATEILAHAWPALILTAAFGAIAVMHLLRRSRIM